MRRLGPVFLPCVLTVAVFAIGYAHSKFTSPPYQFGSQNSYLAYCGLAFYHILCADAAGFPEEFRDVQNNILSALLSSSVATFAWLLTQTLRPGLLPRLVVVPAGIIVPLLTFSAATVSQGFRNRERGRDRAMVIAGDTDIFRLQVDAEAPFPAREREFAVVGFISLTNPREELQSAIRDREPISQLILSDAATRQDDVVAIAEALHRSGVKVLTLCTFYEHHFGKLPVGELSRMALLFDIRDRHNPTFRHIKRAIDVIGALGAALLCAILIPFVLLANSFANRGPLLYRQQRVGRDGVEFTIFKFRTMRPHAHDSLTPWTRIDDPRITPFGRLLRRTHLDELPQAVNILRGELSLVGPRPEQPHLAAELIMKEPAFELRQLVTPGLTGWAQVKFRYAATEAAALEKLQYDLYYVANQSLTLDFRILSRTIRSVIGRRGR